MTILEKIVELEKVPFLKINNLHSPYFDSLMWIFSSRYIWLPFIIVFLCALFYRENWKKIILVILSSAIIIFCCDYIPASVIRPFFHRFRPTHYPGIAQYVKTVYHYKGGWYGFFSNHASNGFGVITFTSLLFKYKYYTLAGFLWILTTIYSRIYLGVHFISDVLAGALWGFLIAMIIYFVLFRNTEKWLTKHTAYNSTTPVFSILKGKILSLCIFLTLISCIISAFFF